MKFVLFISRNSFISSSITNITVCNMILHSCIFTVCFYSNVKAIQKLNETEKRLGVKGSWHDEYKDSAYVFIGEMKSAM